MPVSDHIIPTTSKSAMEDQNMTDHIKQDDAVSISGNSIASDESFTETVVYEHEPFNSFQHKVLALCKDIFPGAQIGVSRMDGGSFNRVCGITVMHLPTIFERVCMRLPKCISKGNEVKVRKIEEFILRIPRAENEWLKHDVNMLFYLAKNHPSIPTGLPFRYDLSSSNKIGSRYTLIPRLPGIRAEEHYLECTLAQRIGFARELGLALRDMQTHHAECPGTLDARSIQQKETSITTNLLQCPHRDPFRPIVSTTTERSISMSVLLFFANQFNRQRQYDLSWNRVQYRPWESAWQVIQKMDEKGLFDDNNYYLTHMDFEPRNMLIHIVDENTAHLGGILDWDEAVFGPVFLNCKPPFWLWTMEDGIKFDNDETMANDVPQNPDLRMIKSAFDNAVGERYFKYAYTPEYRIARTICRIAIMGIHHSDDYNVINKAINEWNSIYPEDSVKGVYEKDNEDNTEVGARQQADSPPDPALVGDHVSAEGYASDYVVSIDGEVDSDDDTDNNVFAEANHKTGPVFEIKPIINSPINPEDQSVAEGSSIYDLEHDSEHESKDSSDSEHDLKDIFDSNHDSKDRSTPNDHSDHDSKDSSDPDDHSEHDTKDISDDEGNLEHDSKDGSNYESNGNSGDKDCYKSDYQAEDQFEDNLEDAVQGEEIVNAQGRVKTQLDIESKYNPEAESEYKSEDGNKHVPNSSLKKASENHSMHDIGDNSNSNFEDQNVSHHLEDGHNAKSDIKVTEKPGDRH